MRLLCQFRRAGIEQGSTGALHLDGFESLTTANKKYRYPNGYLHAGLSSKQQERNNVQSTSYKQANTQAPFRGA